SELISLDAEVIEANEKIRLAVAACDDAAQELGQLEQASARAAAELDALRVALAGAEQQRSDVPAKQVKTLRHTLNPIGREVRGDELHFRLDQGRVARVPVEQLVARLKPRSEEHTSELQSRENLVCRLLLENKNCILKLRTNIG